MLEMHQSLSLRADKEIGVCTTLLLLELLLHHRNLYQLSLQLCNSACNSVVLLKHSLHVSVDLTELQLGLFEVDTMLVHRSLLLLEFHAG